MICSILHQRRSVPAGFFYAKQLSRTVLSGLITCLVLGSSPATAQPGVPLERLKLALLPTRLSEQALDSVLLEIGNCFKPDQLPMLLVHLDRIDTAANPSDRLNLIYSFSRDLFYRYDNREAVSMLLSVLRQYPVDDHLRAKIYMLEGWIDKRSSLLEDAINRLTEAEKLLENAPDSAIMAETYNLIGSCYTDLYQYIPAAEYFSRAIHLAPAVDSVYRYKVLYNMSILYNQIGDTARIRSSLFEVLEGSRKYNVSQLQLYAYLGLATMYDRLKDYDQVISIGHQAIEMHKRRSTSRHIGYIYYLMALAHLEQNDLPAALEAAGAGLQISQEQQELKEIRDCSQALARIYIRLRDYTTALQYVDKIGTGDSDLTSASIQNQLYAEIYYALGHYRQAFDYLQQSKDAEAQINRPREKEVLLALVQRYEAEKQLADLSRLKAEQSQIELKLQRSEFTRNIILALALVSLLSLLLIFNSYRLKKTRQLISLKDSFYQDLHDHVGSSLTRIKLLLARYIRQTNPTEEQEKALNRIRDISNRVMIDMYDLLWSLNPQKERLSDMVDKMEDYLQHSLHPLDIAYVFHRPASDPHLRLSPKLKNNLYGIFKEAINNAVKHASPEQMRLHLDTDSKQHLITLTIENDIKDPPEDGDGERYSGFGIDNMHKRARAVKGELHTERNNNVFTMRLKVSMKA